MSYFFFSSRRRHTRYIGDWSSDVCSSDLAELQKWVEEPWEHWKPHYEPGVQGQVDRHRLAYDEYIQSTDRAFGNFMAELEKDRKSTRLNSSHRCISYAVFCLKKKKKKKKK